MWATPTENFHKRCAYPLTQKVHPLHIALFFTFLEHYTQLFSHVLPILSLLVLILKNKKTFCI